MNLNKIPGQGETGFSRSMLIWGSAFLIFTLLAGLFLWQGNRLDTVSRKSTELASDLRLLSQQMTTQALSASQGFDQSFLLLRQHTQRFDQTLGQLEKGDAGLGVPEFPAELRPELDQVNGQWDSYSRDIDAILSSRDAVSSAAQAVVDAQERLPALMSDSGLVADIIRKNRPGNGSQIYQATNQMVIAERIRNSFAALQSGRDVAVDVADSLQSDTQRFSLVVDGMLRGNTQAGVSQVTVPQAREALQRIVSDFGTVVDNAGLLVEVAPTLFEVKEIAGSLEGKGRELFDGASRIESSIMDRSRTNELWTGVGFILGVLSLLSFLMLVAGIYKTTRQQLDSTTRLNEENEQSIMTLLDEMQTLADGDLTVKATVTQHITGAIADSVNYAVDALRSLVGTINDAAANVAGTARETRETALKLSDASEKQARKIVSASDSVSDLTHSISKVSKSAEASARVADQSLQIAKKGVVSVQKTIDGMDVIRETIQDTSKRIKRLGESSQEIGDIVSLITDIADQTNILALNAAIQASSAGEGGRGFAVVADEVQRLAERAAGASKQIETLVKTIQADTNEAIHSMEKSTSNVVSGARQAEQSGTALADIEKVSRQLAKLIRSISEEAGEQAIVSSVVGEAMASIQSITRQTVESTRETASSIGDLAEQAVDLRRSVEGFRLPGQVQPERPDVPVLGEDEVDDFEEFLISK